MLLVGIFISIKYVYNSQRKFEVMISNHINLKGLVNEGWGDTDTSGWICVGEVDSYYPWADNTGKNKLYIMASPEKVMKWGQTQYDIVYTENNDGTGKQTSDIPSFAKQYINIYPEHQDDEYGEIFLGKRKDNDTLKQMHKEFQSLLFKLGNKIVIHHNSSYRITDGFVKKGKPNGYSNNTDIGIYFWGSRSAGKDPSNASAYTYYCLIDPSELYDFQTNEERLRLEQAVKKYPYAGQIWKNDGHSVVVSTLRETPIWCILDKQTGIWYDKNWQEIKKPF